MKSYNFRAYSTDEALTAGAMVAKIAKGRRLHPRIATAFQAVQRTQETLASLKTAKEQEDDPLAAGEEKRGVHGALLAAKGAFAGLANVLRTFAELPVDGTTRDHARRAFSSLYPNETGMLNGTAGEILARCGRVLERAREKPTAARLAKLGCGPLVKLAVRSLDALREAHAASATSPTSDDPEGDVRTALLDATTALRDYARAVQGVDFVDGTSLHHELLAPFAHRRPKRAPAPTEDRDATEDEDEAPPSRAA